MRVRRDISSIPLQSASDTWACIVNLVTGSDSRDAGQLKAANGVMGSIIADEQPGRRPICSKAWARNCGSIAGSA